MAERLELESEHGKRVMGVLLFQDLAVVPLLVVIPALGSPPEMLFGSLAIAGVKAAALITLLLVGGQRVMRWWLTLVARRKSDELFVLNLLLVTLGLAWLTELAGLSLALGAFIAGILISETEYKHQVETDIRPFHDVLLGLFFITIGMRLDWRLVGDHMALVLVLMTLPVLFKLLVVTVLARMFGASAGVSLRTGLYLAQAGEFGFVLLTLAQQHQLVPPALLSPILASMVLSMLATPFIIMYSNRIVMKLVASEWMLQSLQMTTIARKSINTNKHVIICGYGRCGQNLARILEREGIPYIALDLDPDRVRQAAAAGDSVVFGDAARLQALVAAGLARASAVVVTYLDVPSAKKVLACTRGHAPQVPVIVRTQDDRDLEKLRAAGATEVVPESLEGSLMLASHALALVGVPMRRVIRIVQDQRDARYNLLRGYFHGADDDTVDELETERLTTVTLPMGARSLRPRAQPGGAAGAGGARGQLAPQQRQVGGPGRGSAARGRRHAGAVGAARTAGRGGRKAVARLGELPDQQGLAHADREHGGQALDEIDRELGVLVGHGVELVPVQAPGHAGPHRRDGRAARGTREESAFADDVAGLDRGDIAALDAHFQLTFRDDEKLAIGVTLAHQRVPDFQEPHGQVGREQPPVLQRQPALQRVRGVQRRDRVHQLLYSHLVLLGPRRGLERSVSAKLRHRAAYAAVTCGGASAQVAVLRAAQGGHALVGIGQLGVFETGEQGIALRAVAVGPVEGAGGGPVGHAHRGCSGCAGIGHARSQRLLERGDLIGLDRLEPRPRRRRGHGYGGTGKPAAPVRTPAGRDGNRRAWRGR